MIKKTILSLSLLLMSMLLMGQTAFQSGYIISSEGDTLTGEINFNWTAKPEELTFRAPGENSERLNPADIRGFKIENGDFFQPITVDFDLSPINPANLLEMGEDLFENRSFFAKTLILGSANLYQSFEADKGRYHYFLENAKSDGPIELISGLRSVPADQASGFSNGSESYKELDKYKGQLAFLLGDCAEVQSSIRGLTKLTQKSLTSIITQYNGCNGNVLNYKKAKAAPGSKVKFGVVLGGQLYDVQLENTNVIPDDFNTPFEAIHNIGFHILFNAEDRKRFNIGLLAFHRSFKTSEVFFDDRPIVDGFSTVDYQWDQLTFILNGNFNFGVGDKYLFLSAGPGISFASSASGIKTFESGTIVGLTQDNTDRQFLLNFEAGYQWRRFRAALSYELGASMTFLSMNSSRGIGLRLTYFIPHPNPSYQKSRKD